MLASGLRQRQILILVGVLAASTSKPVHAQLYRYLDIRPVRVETAFPSPGGAYVIFAARRGVPGHAFVMFATEDWYRRLTTIEAFGFYPSVGAPEVYKAAFGSVPGALRDEIASKRDNGCCDWSSPDLIATFKVDRDVFNRAMAVRDRWATQGTTYQVLDQDCVTFLMDVGTGMGLQMPVRGPTNATPVGYMESFIRGLAHGTEFTQRRSTGDQQWRITTRQPSPAEPAGGYSFERRRLGRASGTRRDGSFDPGSSSRRARGSFRTYVRDALMGKSDIFRDGDQYHQLNSPHPGVRPASRYYFHDSSRRPSYQDFAAYPDRDNAPPEAWSGGQYQGDWRHGLPNGNGRWQGANGTVYQGNWRDGAPHGRGEMRLPGGGRYVGTFRGGQVTGRGTYTAPGGTRVQGEFLDGRLVRQPRAGAGAGRSRDVGGEGTAGRDTRARERRNAGETMHIKEVDAHGNVTHEGNYEIKGCC